MTDQLTFELEPGLPRLPDRIRPMLPKSAAAPFDSAAHLFEPSWGGERALAFVEPLALTSAEAGAAPASSETGTPLTSEVWPVTRAEVPHAGVEAGATVVAPTHGLRLLAIDGRDLAPLVPELASLPERVGARSAVLDGELVVVDRHGRPDRQELARRLAGHPGRPVVYLVFDLLYLDARPLLGEALERRRILLGSTVVPGADIVVLPAIAGEGMALFDAVRAQGIAGMMCRERRSPYLPGVRSRLWQYVPAAEQDTAVPEAAETADAASTAPVLALIRRLPFDE